MASPFPARDAKVSAAIDRAFGELFDIEPMVARNDVDKRKAPDTSRTAMTGVTGIWEGPAKSQVPHARGASTDDRAHNWTASFPSVSFDEAILLWTPQPGDKLTRRFDGAIYSIVLAFPDGMGRVLVQLSARKQPPPPVIVLPAQNPPFAGGAGIPLAIQIAWLPPAPMPIVARNL
jgi:hypothetical protein